MRGRPFKSLLTHGYRARGLLHRAQERTMGYHDVALVCENGHAINSNARRSPELNQKFCAKCGAATMDACASCKAPVRGQYHVEGIVVIGSKFHAPSFCHNCGNPYPWTASRLAAAKELAAEAGALSAEEQKQLSESFDDLVKDTPRTPVAVSRTKRLLSKAGNAVAEGVRDILVDIASEAVRKQLWP